MASTETEILYLARVELVPKKKKREKNYFKKNFNARLNTIFFFFFLISLSFRRWRETSDPMKNDRTDAAEVNISRGIVNER